MLHYAVSSFVPDSRYHGFHWPQHGLVTCDAVLQGMPEATLLKVQALPVKHPASLHWQGFARWVVLEIANENFLEQDGFVDYDLARVIFNGPPQDACAFLRQSGLPVPSSQTVHVAGDWEDVIIGDWGVAITGWDGVAQIGDSGLAFASNKEARAGAHGIAASLYASVHAGRHGCAVTVYGISATAGDGGLARTDEFGRAMAGAYGIAISDTGGRAEVEQGGLAIVRGSGTAIVKGSGIALNLDLSGFPGKVQAGVGGLLLLVSHDGGHYRVKFASVGDNGIKPHTPYTLDENGNIVESEPT